MTKGVAFVSGSGEGLTTSGLSDSGTGTLCVEDAMTKLPLSLTAQDGRIRIRRLAYADAEPPEIGALSEAQNGRSQSPRGIDRRSETAISDQRASPLKSRPLRLAEPGFDDQFQSVRGITTFPFCPGMDLPDSGSLTVMRLIASPPSGGRPPGQRRSDLGN